MAHLDERVPDSREWWSHPQGNAHAGCSMEPYVERQQQQRHHPGCFRYVFWFDPTAWLRQTLTTEGLLLFIAIWAQRDVKLGQATYIHVYVRIQVMENMSRKLIKVSKPMRMEAIKIYKVNHLVDETCLLSLYGCGEDPELVQRRQNKCRVTQHLAKMFSNVETEARIKTQ